ncbi:methionine ABC transporter permease [Terribacillus saccharophilus]|uniref:Methionine ABC transporter permease n=3 Tax=Terribacillus saccharophilus TaxID=361277 RepID=A0A268AFZ2_9BACI|nr:methionine ABC transporter permease [Terribacillus saccharophilus]PAF18027.1 methionine ABC transporter permease [Terribacillus saccharophilus]PAF22957.1 methionine ABC transporter permease [Terribacillus saccharophilus]PAF37631.1 methionine ABC transporter permease [Terribacillus saccharophilus]
MTILSLIGTFIIGIILGLLLYLTSRGKLWENKFVYGIVAAVVNIFRAIPFIILILLLFPFTDFIVGTIRGPEAALPALIIGSAPFYARLVEIALKEVDNGVVEAAKAMGAKNSTIMFKVLLKESMPALVSGLTVTAIALIGSTAVAGVIGAGGLGDFAYFYGFQRRQFDVVFICTLLIVIVVFVFQFIGDLISNKLDKR